MDQNVGSFKSLILAHSPENIPTLQQRTVKAGHCVDKVMRVWRLLRVRTQFSKPPAPLPLAQDKKSCLFLFLAGSGRRKEHSCCVKLSESRRETSQTQTRSRSLYAASVISTSYSILPPGRES